MLQCVKLMSKSHCEEERSLQGTEYPNLNTAEPEVLRFYLQPTAILCVLFGHVIAVSLKVNRSAG